MSRNLADQLMQAASAQAFFVERGGKLNLRQITTLKTAVDRLVNSDPIMATQLVERIEQLAALDDDPILTAFTQASRARLCHLSGLHKEADSLFTQAVQNLRAARLSEEAAHLQRQQIDVLTQLGRYDDALQTARSARRGLRHLEATYTAQLETNIGNIYYRLDQYPKALAHYQKARAIFSTAGDRLAEALVNFNISNIFTEMDRHEEALALLKNAVTVWQRNKRPFQASQAQFHIAYLQFLRGRYNTAMATYYQVRDQLTALGAPQLVAWCNLEIAEVLLALNSFDDALENAEAAKDQFTALNLPYESAQAQVTAALAALGARQFERAQVEFADARVAFARAQNATFCATIDAYLAELALQTGQADQAANYAAAAEKVFRHQKLITKTAQARLLAARAAFLSGNLDLAGQRARSAMKAIAGHFAPAIAYQTHHLLGKVEAARGRRSQALLRFRQAVEIVEQMRGGIVTDEFKATFLHDKMDVYENAINACLDVNDAAGFEEAFRLVESAKSRALADLMARYLRESSEKSPRDSGKSNGETTRTRLLKLIEDLNWYSSHAGLEDDKGDQRRAPVAERYRREVNRCEKQIAQLFRRLESEDAAFAESQRLRAASIADLRASLKQGECAIEYFTTGDHLSAFIATAEEVRLVRNLASKSQVERLLAALRFQLEKFNFGAGYVNAYLGQLKHATDDYLAQLYQALFAPLEASLPTRRLLIIPHGVLHYIPFHALRNEQNYLIDRYEISYAPSAAVYQLCREFVTRRQPQKRSGKLVALGIAHRDTPNIEHELRAIGSLFPDSVVLMGEQATRKNLFKAAPKAKFLHLASHGYFRRDNPMFSFLKLSDAPLNFYNLLDLKLQAELVTLSACHTGVNAIFPGDEIHGLMRGFLYAGAPSLVASLWAVSDQSTDEFMREMYRRLNAGESKRQAIRSAQLHIKETFGHPYYWAPFVLIGNPD